MSQPIMSTHLVSLVVDGKLWHWLLLVIFFLLVFAIYLIPRVLPAYFARRLTCVHEIPMLGAQRDRKLRGTAVICGGSIAGLLTARVCADHFENVVIIDPELSETPVDHGAVSTSRTKTRIVQYESMHGFLTFMITALRQLWPSFDTEVQRVGGMMRPGDFKTHFGGILIDAPYAAYRTHNAGLAGGIPETMLLRRPQFESLLERLVLADDQNINERSGDSAGVYGTDTSSAGDGYERSECGHQSKNAIRVIRGTVRRVVPTADKTCLTGVVVRQTDGSSASDVTIDGASLVVDCTGTVQAGLRWLGSAGYMIPSGSRLCYDQKMHYMTITFTVPPELRVDASLGGLPIPKNVGANGEKGSGYENAGWLYTFVGSYRWDKAGFVLTRMDGDTIQMCCGGWGGIHVPKVPENIEQYVRSLQGRAPIPQWVIDTVIILVERGNPVFKPVKLPPCSYIKYQDIADLPSNFVAVGDSAMQLNPVFAQGCSKVMANVITLNALLNTESTSDSGRTEAVALSGGFAKAYFRRSARRTQGLWDSTKAMDYGFTTTRPVEGEMLSKGRLIRLYTDYVLSIAVRDASVASALWHVRMLLAPTTELLTPVVMWKVVCEACSSYFKGTKPVLA